MGTRPARGGPPGRGASERLVQRARGLRQVQADRRPGARSTPRPPPCSPTVKSPKTTCWPACPPSPKTSRCAFRPRPSSASSRWPAMGQAVTDRLQGKVTRIDPMLVEVPLELAMPTMDDSGQRPGPALPRAAQGRGGHRTDERGLEGHARARGRHARRELEGDRLDPCTGAFPTISSRFRPATARALRWGWPCDVGTTTIVVYLVDMSDGRVLAAHQRPQPPGGLRR